MAHLNQGVRLAAFTLSAAALIPVTAARSFAQNGTARTARATVEPAFEVAEVRPSPPSTYPPFMRDGYLIGSRYALRQATMLDMISIAYGLNRENVQGGPAWLDWDRFDITAVAPETTPPATVRLMLRSLLEIRFGLLIHQGTAAMPAWVLSLADQKPKMKPSDGSGQPGCQRQKQSSNPVPSPPPYNEVSCRNETMQRFARELRAMAPLYLNRPVVDSTGLKDAWDFDLKWSARTRSREPGAISIFDAVQNQLGLKLTLATAPTEVFTVESVDEKPTPNLPDIEKRLPPLPPARLEVSVVRPAQAGEETRGGTGGDRIDIHAFTLKERIDFAWFLDPEKSGGMLVDAPKWLDKDRFDIQAKIAGGDAGNIPSESPRIDKDQLLQLLRELLAERFHLKVHFENRPISGYVLVAVAPKMSTASPSERTGCEMGPGADAKNPELANPAIDRFLTCRNVTMAQFGEALRYPRFDLFYFPVQDVTGLKGSYDFTIGFTSSYRLQPRAPSPVDSSSKVMPASEPTGALSLDEAIRKELGLKLEKVQHPEPVLVIDHVDEQPTPN
ncbi:MAG TPA: TIGR03435 family protein [Terracidiphilus sp.]|nr:TIGR03435 family protein [Terracidiphilus sp.]